MFSYTRTQRLTELYRAEISKAMRNIKDPGMAGLLTLTDLQISADSKTVTVYVSVLGTRRERDSTLLALNRAAPFLRQLMRKRLALKLLPTFIFEYDDTPQKASHIEGILRNIESERNKEK